MSSRCQELEYHLPFHIREPPDYDMELPMLSSLRLYVFPYQRENTMWLWNNIARAPHLMHLTLQYLPYSQQIPTYYLRSLVINEVSEGSNLRSILQECVVLESLVAEYVNFGPNQFTQSADIIHLPHLRQLALGTEEPLSLSSLFSTLKAPCLTELKLKFIVYFMDNDNDLKNSFPQDPLVGMLDRHSSSLRNLTLTIDRDDLDSDLIGISWLGILKAVPELTHLNLLLDVNRREHVDEIRELLSAAAIVGSPPFSQEVLVPRLEELVIRLGKNQTAVKRQRESLGQSIIEMAESRSKFRCYDVVNVTPLRMLCLALADEGGFVDCSEDSKGSWSSVVDNQSLTERAKVLEFDGTTCFFGAWKEFLSRFSVPGNI
ncbi:hypothetical protein L218DRAFT_955791 [Marasmius fiardii PR-910]|nr:hypothetical protein L218DRAFT_955791 [Marasmius fiardii PR-910]